MMKIPSNNQTWNSGLISEVKLGRGQRVTVSPNQAIELIVCKLRNANGNFDSANLNPQALLKPGGNDFQMPVVGITNYVGLAVKMAAQTREFALKLQTAQAVQGTVTARITFNVVDSLTVLQRHDVIEELQMEAQRVAQNSIGLMTHMQITQQQVESSLNQLNVAFLGIRIQRIIIPLPVQWPKDLMSDLSEVVKIESAGRSQRAKDNVNIENQRYRNDLIMNELQRLGIFHPEVVMYVLANYERHNSNVMVAVQAAHQEQRAISEEERQQARAQLQKLIDQDLVDRTQLEPLIDKSLRDTTYGQHQAPGSSLPLIPGTQGYLNPPQQGYQQPQFPPQAPPNQLPGQQYAPQQGYQQHPPQQPSNDDATLLPNSHPVAMDGALTCQKSSEGTLTVAGTNTWFALCTGETKIGRRERTNHITITDGGVSREHSVIRRRGAQHFVMTNAKSNIVTLINDIPLGNDERILQSGDRIQIGPIIFIFQIDANQNSTRPSDEDETRFN